MENLSLQLDEQICPIEAQPSIPTTDDVEIMEDVVKSILGSVLIGWFVCWFASQFCRRNWVDSIDEDEEVQDDTTILERSHNANPLHHEEQDDEEDEDDEDNEEEEDNGDDEDNDDNDDNEEEEEQDVPNTSFVTQHVADEDVEESMVHIVTPTRPTTPREPDTPPKPVVLRRSRRLAQQRVRQQSTVLDAVNAFFDNGIRHNKLE